MTLTQQSDLNGLHNDIYEDALFVAREMSLMPSLVTTFNSTGYADRDVPIYAQAVAQSVAEGVDFVTNKKLSKALLAKFTPGEVMAQFLLTDRMVATDPDNARTAAANELGGAIAEKVDIDLLNVFKTFTQSKGSAGSAHTMSQVAAALAVIRNNKARGAASVVEHPYQWHDIWLELGKPAATQALLGDVANQALRDYYVGSFLSVNWYTSANIEVDDQDDAVGGIFTRDAIGLDVRDPVSLRPDRDESLRADELNAHTGYAVGKLRGERGVKLISDASEPAG